MKAELFDLRLDGAWARARAAGVIGESASEIREHAAGYVPAAWRVSPPALVVDIGSGAGVPGLHLAAALPGTRMILVDSSARRCEMAAAAVGVVGLADRVTVHHGRIEDLGHDPEWRESVDGVVARLFGPPADVAECGVPLLVIGGLLIVSASSDSVDWWERAALGELGAALESVWSTDRGSYVAVRKVGSSPARYPRRPAARRRDPLFGG